MEERQRERRRSRQSRRISSYASHPPPLPLPQLTARRSPRTTRWPLLSRATGRLVPSISSLQTHSRSSLRSSLPLPPNLDPSRSTAHFGTSRRTRRRSLYSSTARRALFCLSLESAPAHALDLAMTDSFVPVREDPAADTPSPRSKRPVEHGVEVSARATGTSSPSSVVYGATSVA